MVLALYFSQIDATTFNLGINESNTSGEATIYTGATFTENVDEIFVVIKYEFNKDGNSVAHLFVNPTINGTTEPSATSDTSSITLENESNKSSFTALKINANSNSKTPAMAIDEIRIGTSWADVTTSSTLNIPQKELVNFNVYPNPANNYINIDSKKEKIASVDIINVLGKRVLSQKSIINNRLDISSLKKGIYIMKVKSIENNTITKRLIIN
ncbi:T9SS type A sorting domain-containing protein [Polaribacter sejongensis]|uniref:T9SS type A sorting domain-containing protein n=1 Tax=Polaribacter sejongensis TaxID=985043 RepID=UPI0035A5E1CC